MELSSLVIKLDLFSVLQHRLVRMSCSEEREIKKMTDKLGTKATILEAKKT